MNTEDFYSRGKEVERKKSVCYGRIGGGHTQLNSRGRVPSILRENYHRVWPDAHFAGAGQSIGFFLMSFDVRGRMIGKIRAIVVGVTIKARFPQSGSWKTDDIPLTALISHINYHNYTIGWSLFVPPMESNELGLIVKMIGMDVLTAQPPRHTRQVAP